MIQDAVRLAADPKNKLGMGTTTKTDEPKYPLACGFHKAKNEGGSRCRKTTNGNCPNPVEIKLCSLSDQNCGAGTCTPFVDHTKAVDRGFCK